MKSRVIKTTVAGLLFTFGTVFGTANAGIITEADFSGSETVIDFNSIADEQAINTQYIADGVTFAGAILGMTNPGDTTVHNGSTIASNWCYSCSSSTGALWSATFDSMQNLVGFGRSTNRGDGVTVELFAGAISLGSTYFASTPGGYSDVDFVGVSSVAGFDRIEVTTETNANGFFSMDNFRFESESQAIPEPSTAAILALGLVALGVRRSKKSA